jgi:hypothetical protein
VAKPLQPGCTMGDGGRLIGELDAIMSRGVTLAFGVGGRTVEEDEASVSSSS